MSKLPTADKLREAREAVAEARSAYDALASKLGTDEWKEDVDGPALDAAKRSFFEAEKQVNRLTDTLEIESRKAPNAPAIVTSVGDDWGKARKEFRLLKAVERLSTGGNLDGLEAEMHQEGQKEIRTLQLPKATGNLVLPQELLKRDMLAGTPSAGGYTVETQLGGLIPVLEPKLQVMDMGATLLDGLTGNVDFPRGDSLASASWKSETGTLDETSPTFDAVELRPHRLGAFTEISRQVMVQSTIKMENYIRRQLTRAVGRAVDLAAINGSGLSNQPLGILNTPNVNDINIGTDGGPLDWSLIVKFETETAMDDADMGRLGYLTTPGVAGALKTTKRDVAGNNFIWEGPNGDGGTINGYRARVTTLMPSNLTKGGGTDLHTMIFGNWEELLLGRWGGVDILVDPYSRSKDGMVVLLIHSFWDVALRHLESFCICNEIEV